MAHEVFCSQGHSWDPGREPENNAITCPVCGGAARELSHHIAVPEMPHETATFQFSESRVPEKSQLPQIPDYHILEILGQGGMGVVYKARHAKLNRLVALKMILKGHAAGSDHRDRFRAEAEAVARLQHPNIIQIYEIGEFEGQPFFSLEYAAEGNLAQRMAGTPLPVHEAAHLVETLARAAQAAHMQGIVHRDLKPANVLLQSAVPKITDFGLAKRLDVDMGQTHTGAILGTPSYMAPEQAAGQTGEIGPAVDIYALGAILYESLTGRPPFKAATLRDTLEQVCTQEPVPPRRLQPNVPRDLETICLKCLQKEKHKRYETALAVADDLYRFQIGKPIVARPIAAWERVWKLARRRPAVAALSALLLVLTVVSLAVVTWLWQDAEQARIDADDRATKEGRARIRADEKEKLANKEADHARKESESARRHLYVAHINLAQSYWQSGQTARVRELLRELKPHSDHEDLRGFEWYYLARQCHTGLNSFQGHLGPIFNIAFTPDGKRLASASGDGTIKIWDVESGTFLRSLDGQARSVYSLAFRRDGRHLATLTGGPIIHVWDVTNGKQVLRLTGHKKSVYGVAYSPDGKVLATASDDQTVKLWDAATGKELRTLSGNSASVVAVAFSPDGQWLASGGRDNIVKLWSLANGTEAKVFQGHRWMITDLAFSPDSKTLASASADQTARLWDVATGRESFVLVNHKNQVQRLAFRSDGKYLATASWDQLVKIWDVATGKEETTLRGHSFPVYGVAFRPGAHALASCSGVPTNLNRPGEIRLWDLNAPDPGVVALRGHSGVIHHVDFSPNNKYLVSASNDGVKLWSLAENRELYSLKGHQGPVWCVAISPDSQTVASSGDDKTVRLWSTATGKELFTLKGLPGPVRAVAFSPDSQRVAAGAQADIILWDAQTGKELLSFRRYGDPGIYGMAFSPDGKTLAVGNQDYYVGLFDLAKLRSSTSFTRAPFSFRGHAAPISTIAYSPDGKLMVSAAGTPNDYMLPSVVKVWETATGRELFRLRGHGKKVFRAVFSSDGKRLASVGADQTVKIWDAVTGQELLSLQGDKYAVEAVAFSSDSRRIATGGNGVIKIWDGTPFAEKPEAIVTRGRTAEPIVPERTDVPVGKEILTVNVRPKTFWSAAISPDGRYFLSGTAPSFDAKYRSLPNGLQLWDADTGKEVRHFDETSLTFNYVSLTPDGKFALSAHTDGSLHVWDVATGKKLRSFRGHRSYVRSVVPSPDGRWVLSAGDDGYVRLWDFATAREIRVLVGHTSLVREAVFSPDGKWIVSGGQDNTVRLWETETGNEIRRFEGHTNMVASVAFSPDGKRILSASYDQTIRLWDRVSGEELGLMQGHSDRVIAVRFTKDGKRAVSGSYDHTARLWDLQTFREIGRGYGGAGQAQIIMHPDGRRVLSAGRDGTLRVWKLPD